MATPDPITLASLTEAKIDGSGAFDTLMRAMSAHLNQEFQENRLRGADYANVYLTALTPVLQNAVVFLLQKDEAAYKAQLVEAQVRLTEAQIKLAEAELEREILTRDLIAAQTAVQVQQVENLKAEECVLKANFDIALSTNLQTVAQTSLVNQKVATEKAQTSAIAIEPNSVIGKQIALYTAQADGFQRDAEQKAAKLMIDSWNVRRTTDVGTVADVVNQLNDANVGRAVNALLGGVNA
ncbi:virion structural protein [Pseudomonas phage phCDa]|uniref:Uncharacterized protein n=1 Tax=Pseudomonas phage phCDa TaxID=2268587 RepID=A0A2Z5H8R4_9CAUD|nr:virion structural protein [Pseudomonas phage phCDa]AXC36455.1 hypothetical protein phCDa_11 [Pseudomonas phage phCDa]